MKPSEPQTATERYGINPGVVICCKRLGADEWAKEWKGTE